MQNVALFARGKVRVCVIGKPYLGITSGLPVIHQKQARIRDSFATEAKWHPLQLDHV